MLKELLILILLSVIKLKQVTIFLLDPKYAMKLLTLIKNLFNHGKVIVRKEDMYRYYCDTFVGLAPIITYFDTFPLKTKKAVTLHNWKQVYNMVIKKEHLTERIRADLIKYEF